MANFKHQWQQHRERAQQALTDRLPAPQTPLSDAMHYSCLQGGKRFRATLVYACGKLVGAEPAALDAPAAAIEMIHAYSLVHDDLPAMDDDDLRRGQPTCHIKYDEATAVLVGDALQSLAFETLCNVPVSAEQQLAMLHTLATASGCTGMAGGQALDMAATGNTIELDALKQVHRLKTGALIQASIRLGVLASAQHQQADLDALTVYGRSLGLAFQVADDILDQTQSSQKLGKASGADILMDKSTYPRLMGLEGAQNYAQKLLGEALESLTHFGDNSLFLRQLADFAVNRDH